MCLPLKEGSGLQLSRIFERIRCVLACCGGKITIENCQADGPEDSQTTRETVL